MKCKHGWENNECQICDVERVDVRAAKGIKAPSYEELTLALGIHTQYSQCPECGQNLSVGHYQNCKIGDIEDRLYETTNL